MDPKDKADKLVKKMYAHTGWLAETEEGFDRQDVECALICVDEIISDCEYNNVESYNTDWWNKVKDEIRLL